MTAAFDEDTVDFENPIYGIPPDEGPIETVLDVQSRPWTIDERIKRLNDAGIDGREITFINLDTGYTRHDLLPVPLSGRNFTGGSVSDVTDRHGHGNHTIGSNCGRDGLSACPAASFRVGKVLGDNGSGSNTVSGLRWAASEPGDIVSCSWGGGSSVGSTTTAALKEIEDSGKWCFFSAGNSGYNGSNTVIAPALSPHCIAVAASDRNGNPAGFSSGGPAVDLIAGGVGIISCGIRNNLVTMSGTSMSCPTLASLLGLLRQVLRQMGYTMPMTSRGLMQWLVSEDFIKDAGPIGRDPRFGEGFIKPEHVLTWIEKRALGQA
jgi:subtilisin family serine protease